MLHIKSDQTWGSNLKNTREIAGFKPTLHYVDSDTRGRARLSNIALHLGNHCELYDDLNELSIRPPRDGIIIMKDGLIWGGIVSAMERLAKLGVWLPVIAIGDQPSPQTIVQAIKTGALDYLPMPVDAERLQRSLDRTAEEAKHVAITRRNVIVAQSKIDRLSGRECEVLNLLSEGNSNKQIARDLGISPRTVEIHRANMMLKLEADHPASAVRIKIEAERFQYGSKPFQVSTIPTLG